MKSARDTAEAPIDESGRRLVYLAAERTLLSWVRVSIGLVALGFAVDRFGLMRERGSEALRWDPWSSWIGLTLIFAGALTSAVSAVHYRHFTLRYKHGDPHPEPGVSIAVGLSFAITLVACGLAIYVWLASR